MLFTHLFYTVVISQASENEELNDEDLEEMLSFEQKRSQNLKDNADFLAKLGMSSVKQEFKQTITKTPKDRGYKEK